ncbi:hypothetical protein IscW_ISCW018190 [Ixodes scapularis]|uniref:Uncharacterized protein n=1 Tax=Ixodes scapularis TaxID=6945 RepID=B7PDZ9_IXOSC|nr:hypothetical protein IscW_ISCW018190 [Ixodes scapularis]|eukprot:XP_002399577.1 hypothetical protein IscW_ISCW018190 [Ixodes scapularis]
MRWLIVRDFRVFLTLPRNRNDLTFGHYHLNSPTRVPQPGDTVCKGDRCAKHFNECTIPVCGYMESSLSRDTTQLCDVSRLQLSLSMVHPWSQQPPCPSGSFILVETVPRRNTYPWCNWKRTD